MRIPGIGDKLKMIVRKHLEYVPESRCGRKKEHALAARAINPEAKQARHDTVFPEEKKRAFEMGALLAE